jgi:hypothetical protein
VALPKWLSAVGRFAEFAPQPGGFEHPKAEIPGSIDVTLAADPPSRLALVGTLV